jgi:catechol 2,3-dioxygenase-like lactoylglutathione lyase family enzyme
MTVLGIDHVQVAAPPGAEPEARRFYGELLGLEEIPRPATMPSPHGCWFRVGSQELHVGIEDPFRAAAKAHPSLVVDDLRSLVDRLGDAGVPAKPDTSIPGVERCYVHDPFGNRIELRQA